MAALDLRPVNVIVEKRKRINLPFIKWQQFNGLQFRNLPLGNTPIALKKGVDIFQANL